MLRKRGNGVVTEEGMRIGREKEEIVADKEKKHTKQ
jgi:hypothetical protein